MPNPDDLKIRFTSLTELQAVLAGLQTQTDGSVWMSIPRGLVIKDPTPRRIQFFEDEISIDGEPLSLSSKQYLALSCFQYKNTVREVEVAAAVYKDITKNHDAIPSSIPVDADPIGQGTLRGVVVPKSRIFISLETNASR